MESYEEYEISIITKMGREDSLKKISLLLCFFSASCLFPMWQMHTEEHWNFKMNTAHYQFVLKNCLSVWHCNEGCMEIMLYFGLNWS